MPLFELTLNGESALETHSFSVREGISRLFECEIVAMSHDAAIDLEPIVGQPGQLLALSGASHVGGRRRSWRGVVSCAEQLRVETLSEKGQSTYSITIVPSLWLLTQRQGHRIFQHLSIPEIADKLLAEWNIPHVWTLTASYDKLEYKVQYGETDYAFLCRLLEEAGIAFTFPDHAPIDRGEAEAGFVDATGGGWSGGSLLTFSDDPTTGEDYPGSPIHFVDEPNASAQMEFVTEVQLTHGVRPGAVTVRDHDFRKPSFPLLAEAPKAPGQEALYEQYSYLPGAFLVEGGGGGDTPVADDKGVARHKAPAGTSLAARRLVAQRQGKRRLTFTSNVFGLQPAMLFTMENHPQPELDQGTRLLIIAVKITGGHGESWSTEATAVFAADKYRPPLDTPRPQVFGVQSATVVGPAGEEIYTDEFGRVRVQFPWDREGKADDDSSCWMRVSQGWAGAGFGAINLPRVGQEVLVGFIAGDPDQPMVVGRVFNATSQAPYKLPDYKSRSVWRSRSYPGGAGFNEITFEDAADKELVYLQAQKNRYQLVKNDESIQIGHDREKLVSGNEDEVTSGDHRTHVLGGRHVIVEAVKKELVGGDSHLRVRGDEIHKVGGDSSLATGGDVHLAAGRAIVIEGTTDLTLRGPGGFIRIDETGVTIVGTLVNINSGGAPGTSSARGTPDDPDRAQAGPAMDAAITQLQLTGTQAAARLQLQPVSAQIDLSPFEPPPPAQPPSIAVVMGIAPPPPPTPLGFDPALFERRPNQPDRSAEAKPGPVTAPDAPDKELDPTLHHVVPWNQLKAFAQTAAAQGHNQALVGLLQDSVATMMANSPIHDGEPKQGSMTHGDLSAELARTEGERNPEAMDAVVTSLCWMPGNLFQGPDRNLRSEDPDEKFEQHAQEAVGKNSFDRLTKANQEISEYLAAPTPERASTISQLLAPSAQRRMPFTYEPDHWRAATPPEGFTEDVKLYKLKNAPDTNDEHAVFQAKGAQLAKARKQKEEAEEHQRRVMEERANKPEESDDEDMGLDIFG